MSKRIPQSFIDQILMQTDIVALVSSCLTLKKTGSNHKAPCPFHREKTPSFTVNHDKQIFHCFGCHEGGNAITFAMKYEQLDFRDALEHLANRLGLELPEGSEQEASLKTYHQLLEDASAFYCKARETEPDAVAYLTKRGIKDETLDHWQIGYAPAKTQTLTQSLMKKGYTRDEIQKAGLLNKQQKPLLRHRVVFPIKDHRNRVIAFGGRALTNDQQPKYLNFSETPLFKKSQALYGIQHIAKRKERPKSIFIVEGYMDTIALSEKGIDQVVGMLGTALTKGHLTQLMRYTDKLIFCFDGDTAGKQAAWRSLERILPLLNDQMHILFIFLPEGEDPDSIIRQKGRDYFIQAYKKASALTDFFFDHMKAEHLKQESLSHKALFAKKCMDYLDNMPHSMYRALMIKQLAKIVDLNARDLMEGTTPEDTNNPSIMPQEKEKQPKNKQRTSLAEAMITLLLQHPKALKKKIQDHKTQTHMNEKEQKTFKYITQHIAETDNPSTASLIEAVREEEDMAKKLTSLALKPTSVTDDWLETQWQTLYTRHHIACLSEDIDTLIKQADTRPLSTSEKKALHQLISEKNHLKTELSVSSQDA